MLIIRHPFMDGETAAETGGSGEGGEGATTAEQQAAAAEAAKARDQADADRVAKDKAASDKAASDKAAEDKAAADRLAAEKDPIARLTLMFEANTTAVNARLESLAAENAELKKASEAAHGEKRKANLAAAVERAQLRPEAVKYASADLGEVDVTTADGAAKFSAWAKDHTYFERPTGAAARAATDGGEKTGNAAKLFGLFGRRS